MQRRALWGVLQWLTSREAICCRICMYYSTEYERQRIERASER